MFETIGQVNPLHRAESKPLLFLFVGTLSLLLHIPLTAGAIYFFPATETPLDDSYTVEPIHLVEDPLDEEESRQMVSRDRPEKEEEPENAKLLDRYSQRAEKEMMRKADGRRPGGVKTAKRRPQRPPKSAPARSNTEAKTEGVTALPPDKRDDSPGGLDADDPTKVPGGRVEDKIERDPGPPGETTAPDEVEPSDDVLPDNLSEMLPNFGNAMPTGEGGTGETLDFLDVPEGDKDLLNRKSTRYWAFFDRLKRAVKREWRPHSVYRSHDPRGQIYGVKDRLTIVRVTLNGDGALKGMYVEKPSGLAFLDQEAVRAFRTAQPFPNPPEGLKDDKGQVKFSFGFMYEIHSRVSRIIRYQR